MEKFTKSQRVQIYELALEVLQREINNGDGRGTGFCYMFEDALQRYHYRAPKAPELDFDPYESMEETAFPEIIAHRPDNFDTIIYRPDNFDTFIYGFWWDTDEEGLAKRAKILKDAIAELSKKLRI